VCYCTPDFNLRFLHELTPYTYVYTAWFLWEFSLELSQTITQNRLKALIRAANIFNILPSIERKAKRGLTKYLSILFCYKQAQERSKRIWWELGIENNTRNSACSSTLLCVSIFVDKQYYLLKASWGESFRENVTAWLTNICNTR